MFAPLGTAKCDLCRRIIWIPWLRQNDIISMTAIIWLFFWELGENLPRWQVWDVSRLISASLLSAQCAAVGQWQADDKHRFNNVYTETSGWCIQSHRLMTKRRSSLAQHQLPNDSQGQWVPLITRYYHLALKYSSGSADLSTCTRTGPKPCSLSTEPLTGYRLPCSHWSSSCARVWRPHGEWNPIAPVPVCESGVCDQVTLFLVVSSLAIVRVVASLQYSRYSKKEQKNNSLVNLNVSLLCPLLYVLYLLCIEHASSLWQSGRDLLRYISIKMVVFCVLLTLFN